MNATIETLEAHCISSIRYMEPSLNERSARRLLDVHLLDANFAMPIHSVAAEEALLAHCQNDRPIEEASRLLSFECTRSMAGIARVLARTHINSQGVGRVRRGARWPVQSYRVLGLFDEIHDSDSLRRWFDHRELMADWLMLARNNQDTATDEDRRFAQEDIEALNRLLNLTPEEARNRRLPLREKLGAIGENWGRVALGLHTGLLYLNQRFDFDSVAVWDAVDSATDAHSVEQLCLDAARHITHFGAALAPSFFADLGSTEFVKPDVHVIDSVSAALNLATEANPALAIATVRRIATQVGCSPRRIDKLMYFACSGKFFLAGMELDKKSARQRKQEVLRALREGPVIRRPSIA